MAICPHCGREVPDDAIVCPYCGAQINPDYVVCGNCGRLIPADAKVCPYCGVELSDTVRCPNCGREIPANAKSCPYCGYRFDVDQPVVNIEYAKTNTETPVHHIYKVRAPTKKKEEKKPKTLLESEVFSSAPIHAFIGLVLSLLILILGLMEVVHGYQLLSDTINSVGSNTDNSLNAIFFSYGSLLAVEALLIFIGLIYSIKYFTIQEKEIVCAFIYTLLLLTYILANSYGFFVGFIWGITHSSSTQRNINSAATIYEELTYVILLISIIATYVSAYSTRRS